MVQIKTRHTSRPSAPTLLLALLLAPLLALTLLPANSFAGKQHITLYDLSKPYWDIKPNETLGEIVEALLPTHIKDRQAIKQQLITHIIESNRHAFINNDPKRMLAHQRLWFTNAKPTQDGSNVKRYSWGYIKEPDTNK